MSTSDEAAAQDVDIVKAVAWWYDHRHDGGTDHDVVKLTIEKIPPSGPVTRISDDDGKDLLYCVREE